MQAWTNSAPKLIRRARAWKTSEAPDFSGAHILPYMKKKTLDLSLIGKAMKM